jgi:hypothetical protein
MAPAYDDSERVTDRAARASGDKRDPASGQSLFQDRSGARKPALERCSGPAQYSRGLVSCNSLKAAEHDCSPKVGGEARQFLVNCRAQLAAAELFERIFARNCEPRFALGRL